MATQKIPSKKCDLSGGVTVATVLPFDSSGKIDWSSYSRVLDYCTT